jgi:uroporphyrinogen decarboxylase
MVCAGIHQPTYGELDILMKEKKDISLFEYLQKTLDITYLGPAYIGPPLPEKTDYWGVRRKKVDFGLGSYDEIEVHPLAEYDTIDELKEYAWPQTDWFDYAVIPAQIERINANEEYCLIAGWGAMFEASWFMRGFEKALMDLVLNPELINYIFEKVTEFQVEFHRKILEAGKGEIDLIFCADDIGTQRDLLMSLETWEKNIKPYHMRIMKVIHEYGAQTIYHTDGAVMKAVSGLIDMGVDILQALQFDAAGMDPVVLKDEYGDRLCFEGGISVQKTLPFGTVEEVEQETLDRIRVLGRGGGYILGPSHAIQAGTPAENVFMMFETAANYRM